MRAERPRAARYHFIATVTVTDLDSGHQSQENTWNLSLYGCQVMPGSSVRTGTRVRVHIIHNGEAFEALGLVANVRPLMGIGILFTKVEDHHQQVLDRWLAALRNKRLQPH